VIDVLTEDQKGFFVNLTDLCVGQFFIYRKHYYVMLTRYSYTPVFGIFADVDIKKITREKALKMKVEIVIPEEVKWKTS